MSRCLPCESGDTRRAALRPFMKAPVKVFPGCPGFPNRDAHSNASPPRLAPRSIVRIDVHGSKDRAKDASPGACDDLSCLRRVHALDARMPTAFPSSASFGHPLSSARVLPVGGNPGQSADRPRPSFRQRPAKGAVIQKTGMPFTITPREGFTLCAEGIIPPAFAPALPLTPPTLPPAWGECF